MKVVAALSGGVDSAVAAARAVDAGHEVVGVHLALSASQQTHRNGSRGCCTLEDSRDARRIADVLGIPFYIWDLSEEFRRDVVDDFIAEYQAGRTPNPCIRCNESIKFSAVLNRARALGFDAICTGHYARIESNADGQRALLRGVDPKKDQSYVLGVLSQQDLSQSMFPLGDSTKDHVRQEAAARGLLVADKSDSYDVCFIPDGDTGAFLRSQLGDQPGDIDDGRARFVLSIEPVNNTVVVGPRESLAVQTLELEPTINVSDEEVSIFDVQWRAHGSTTPAHPVLSDSNVVEAVVLVEPAYGIAAGQELVMYHEERVVGSARIRSATS